MSQKVYNVGRKQKTDENRHHVGESEEIKRGQRFILRLALGIKIPLQIEVGCEYKNTLGLIKKNKELKIKLVRSVG